MKVCGIEIKSNEAIICLLSYTNGLFTIPECRVKKLELKKVHKSSDIRYFAATFKKLMSDYKVEEVVIKERPQKGKFAGGAIGFKIEALIQSLDGLEVNTISPTLIKQGIKKNPVPVHWDETGLKHFQKASFEAAYVGHMINQYGEDAFTTEE